MLLVTGGAGYIGSQFVKNYLDNHPNDSVVVVDNLVYGHAEALASLKNVELIKVGIGDKETLSKIFKQNKIGAVVHFAAYAYVGESQENPQKYFENNVIQSLHLFDAMAEAGVNRIVFSSTCATYGNPVQTPIDETHPQKPINVYGLTKYMVERALSGYAETKKWSVACLRYFNAAGASETGLMGESHEPETHLIPLVLQVAKGQRKKIDIYGTDYDTPDGTCIRDYIHVADLADAHLKALTYLKDKPGYWEAFNLGTTHGASVKEVIEICRQVTQKEIVVNETARRPGDPAILVAGAGKAQSLLGWKAKYGLKEIIETAWQWEQNRSY